MAERWSVVPKRVALAAAGQTAEVVRGDGVTFAYGSDALVVIVDAGDRPDGNAVDSADRLVLRTGQPDEFTRWLTASNESDQPPLGFVEMTDGCLTLGRLYQARTVHHGANPFTGEEGSGIRRTRLGRAAPTRAAGQGAADADASGTRYRLAGRRPPGPDPGAAVLPDRLVRRRAGATGQTRTRTHGGPQRLAEREPLSGFLLQFALNEAAGVAPFTGVATVTAELLDGFVADLAPVPLRPMRVPGDPTRHWVAPGLVVMAVDQGDNGISLSVGSRQRSALRPLRALLDWDRFDG